MDREKQVRKLEKDWSTNPRWWDVVRPYRAEDVVRLRGSLQIEHTLARNGAEKLWGLLTTQHYMAALGAADGNQAVQMVRGGLSAVHCAGSQGGADVSTELYPDRIIQPIESLPAAVRRLNAALLRADQIHTVEGVEGIEWFVPIIADAQGGHGGALNAFELTKGLIAAGAAAVQFDDQSAYARSSGHLGGKVLVPTMEALGKLVAARLAADVLGVPTIVAARTDALGAGLLTSDADPRDGEFLTGQRSADGLFVTSAGLEPAISRALAYAPFADLIWLETATPEIGEARTFAEAVQSRFPGKRLAYSCTSSEWKRTLDAATIAEFQRELADMGYRLQVVPLAGCHALDYATFDLAERFRDEGMPAYVRLQEAEGAAQERGYIGTRYCGAGRGYFDEVARVIQQGTPIVPPERSSAAERLRIVADNRIGRTSAA